MAMKLYSDEWKALVSVRTKIAMSREDVALRHRVGCSNRKVSKEGRLKQSVAQLIRFEKQGTPDAVRELRSMRIAESVVSGKGYQDGWAGYGRVIFRSEQEARVANELDDAGLDWEYEPEVHVLGYARRYVPDFKIGSTYVEVKPRSTIRDVVKLSEFKKMHHLIVVGDGRVGGVSLKKMRHDLDSCCLARGTMKDVSASLT